MRRRGKAIIGIAVLGALGLGLGIWTTSRPADAADHNDPPSRVTGTSADREADIADVFAWHTDDGKTVIALTFAGPNDPVAGQAGMYDRDVLYTIHIDTDDDREADHSILARFGVSESGNWGLQLQGVPGADGTQAGAVEYVNRIAGSEGFFWAGLREDPFFFDLEGFQDTLANGTLGFDNTRDFFAGKNSSAIVIELETADINAGTDNTFSVWATTARFGG
jgi:hypothetical protein